MRKIFGEVPPQYSALLRLTVWAVLLRCVPLAPFVVAYVLPPGPWFRLILLACPVLWWYIVCPARVRYGRLLAAFAADSRTPLPAKALLTGADDWRAACRLRLRRMRRAALPLLLLMLFLLTLLVFFDVFAAMKLLLHVFSFVASALATAAAFLPRILTGQGAVVQAGLLGGVITLFGALGLALLLYLRAAFRTAPMRYGYTARPGRGSLRPLLRQNLRVWLPTLILSVVLLVFSYGELSLLFANALSAAPVFSVKLQLHQWILLGLTVLSYLLGLPLRRVHTAVWAVSQTANKETGVYAATASRPDGGGETTVL